MTMPGAEQPPLQPRIELIVPEDQSAGVYSNGFGTWFNQTDFTIDFFVHLPAQQKEDESGPFIHTPVQVVSRVKVPTALLWRLIQQLNTSYTQYEAQFGPVVPVGDVPPQPDVPPAAG
jgi:Protein of unknown function (DUF3467)